MGTDKRSESAALVSLLRSRPDGLSWAEITAQAVEAGSAIEVWNRLVPPALFTRPGDDDPLVAAGRDLDHWEAQGLKVLTVLDDDYPDRLRGIHQVPPILFARGHLVADDQAVSVVGSRVASDRGRSMAANITKALVAEGITAVAGLAHGIDTEVHVAALDAGGRTVAVIGNGINKTYPAANRSLQEKISGEGLLISQFWPDAPPQKQNFLMRNATMSGYSLATVVVEAGETSGTRTQARLAVEHGRPVILTDSVMDSNEWAKKMNGRPGVYRAESVRDILAIVRSICASRRSAEHELLRPALSSV